MTHEIAIVGAGPYGLATAAHLKKLGVPALVFGETMGAWTRMPTRMLLRSFREATNIGDPEGRLGIDAFAAERGIPVPTPVPVADFIEYGKWFQSHAAPEADARLVERVERTRGGFRLSLTDGATTDARAVVVAAGIEPFAYVPQELSGLDKELLTHSSQHVTFAPFAGRRLVIVGAGQSALEWAVLAAEAGADVEVITRRSLRFLRGERLHARSGVFRTILYPALGVGPPGLNWLMGYPAAYRRLPRIVSVPLAQRSIRPAGAAWLRPRLTSVAITSGVAVTSIAEQGDGGVVLRLADGSTRLADHVIAATGYRVDISSYAFLADLLNQIRLVDGFPWLTNAYESAASNIYFVGAPAARMMGPGMRFVSHSGPAGAAVARRIAETLR
jgi:FAD-dependent urate hydroxylase